MTNEEKRLLLIDLCARLPYGVILNIDNGKYREDKKLWPGLFNSDNLWSAKPYLHPISSMTEEERNEWMEITHAQEWLIIGNLDKATDWLNKNHFDYRGLIPMGLAIEAPVDMYKN